MFSFLKSAHIGDFSMIHRHSTQSPKAEGSSTLAVSEQQPRSRSNSPAASAPSPSKSTTAEFAVGDEVLVVGDVNTPMVSAVITQVVAPTSAGQSYRYRVREKGSDRIFSAAYPETLPNIDESDLINEGRLVRGSKASLRDVVDAAGGWA